MTTKKKLSTKSSPLIVLSRRSPVLTNVIKFIVVFGVILGIVLFVFLLTKRPIDLTPPPANALYHNATQPVELRVEDLLSRMTQNEKIGQMALVDKNSLIKQQDIARYHIGAVLSGAGAKPATNTTDGWLGMTTEIKRQTTNTRLNIPLLYGIDATHGNANVPGATVFPHAIGLGASNDPALVEKIATASAEELAATGMNWSFSPNLDAPKDIRWGRVYEAFSDDATLNSSLGAAFVRGTDSTGVLSTAKHFLGAGSMQWNSSFNRNFKIDQGKTPEDSAALQKYYLPPFAAASQAGVSSVMVGLSQWGDKRLIINKDLITEKLKNQQHFRGFVVSDWYGVYERAGDSYRASVDAINAGVDMAMLPFDYKRFEREISSAVQRGDIKQSRIDDAVRRIIRAKFEAGLFESGKDSQIAAKTIGSAENRSLARQAVAESAVLLKNNTTLLPLSKQVSTLVVAGSGADNVGRQSGAWTVEWQGIDGNWLPGSTSILQGIRQTVSSSTIVHYSKDAQFNNLPQKAEVGIAVISEKPYAEGWGDNPNPTIDAADRLVIARLKAVSQKLVVVIISGRPLLISDQIPNWDAAIAQWLPGSEGAGVSDVLFGNHPFTGRLPLPWPATMKQVPIQLNDTTADGTAPLFARYYGLST